MQDNTITATANGKSASCTVTVKESSIILNTDTMQLSNRGTGSSIKLVPSIVGSKKTVKWASSDKTIAIVSNGKVTGKKTGTATITATVNGVSDTCTVSVTEGLVSINEEKIQLYTGGTKTETKQLKTNAGKKDLLVWSSSDDSIATVDNGLVTAKGEGTAIINARCNGKTDSCEVTVKNTVTEIGEDTVFLRTKGSDKTYQLNSSVTGRSSSVKWTSSDNKVASVNKGKVTAKKVGTAIITATANGVSDSVIVTVEDYLPTIKLNQSNYVLYTNKGNIINLKATVDGKSKTVSWSSSNKAVATVNKGKVTAVSEGEAIISATANDVTAECLITVRQSKVILENENLHLNKGETGNIPVDVIGKSQTIKWSTTNSKVATVKNGVVTAKNYGEADIKVTANGITAICHVNVSECQHNFDEGKVTKEPSCTEEGTCLYTCTICGYSYIENIPTVEHKWGEWATTKEPTETEMGIQIRSCAICGAEESAFLHVLEHTHRYERSITEPTCTEDGYTTYKCSCGDSYTDDVIPALGHTWGEWQVIKEPTEKEAGERLHVCSICKAEKTEEIPVLGHTHKYEAVIIEPTCTEDGYTIYECSCGDSYKDDIVPALGHKWSNWQIIKEASESEAGEKKRVCSVCGTEETEEIPNLSHTHKYEAIIIEPTCTEDGYTMYECSCGDSYMDDVVPALGHKWSNWQIIREATESEAGEKKRVCSVCGTEETEKIPNLSHTHKYEAIIIEPTCTEDGYTIHECSCGDSYKDDIVPALGHKWSDWQIIKEASESEAGEKKRVCSACETEEAEEIPVLEHVHKYSVADTVEPTCTEDGYTIYECSCGDSYMDDVIPALGHQYTTIVTEPTCTEQGYATYTCELCGNYYRDDFVDTAAHVPSEWVITREPTCGDEGIKETHCINCNCTMEIEWIDKLQEHDYKVKSVKEPTNCSNGYTLYECAVCGATKRDNYIPYTGDGEHEMDYYNLTPYDNDKYQVFCKICGSYSILTMNEILKYREVDTKIKEVISEIITDDMNDVEKIFAVNKWICLNCYYDHDTADGTENSDEDSRNAYGMICKGKAVCQGYALAFKEFMNVLGIECKVVAAGSLNHAWNQVRLDDGWYWIDCTWNDPEDPDFFNCDYFLRTGQRVEDEEGGTVCDGTKWADDWLLLFDKYKASNDNELNSIYELQKENDIVYFRFNSESDYEMFMDVNGEYFEKYGGYIDYEIIVKDKSDTKMYLMFMKNTDNIKAFFSERTLTVTNPNEPEPVESSESVEDNEIVEDSESIEVDESTEVGESVEESEFTEENESSEVSKTTEKSEFTKEDEIVEENELTATSMLLVS